MAIGPAVVLAGCFAVFIYVAGHANLAQYLQVTPVSDVGEMTVVCGAMVGAGLGFLSIRKMNNIIISFRIRIVRATATDKEAPVLILIVTVAGARSTLIDHHVGMIVRIVKPDTVDIQSVVTMRQKLETTVFIAGIENQFADMFIR